MRKIVTGLFTSLDGVVGADSDWQFPYFDDELLEWIASGSRDVDTVLMGRHSFAGYSALRRDHADSPILPFLERADRYLVSTTQTDTDWPGTTILSHDVSEQLTDLKQQSGGKILVAGSPTLVRWLLAHDLLDELAVCVLPIIVGSGPRLFPESDSDSSLTRRGLGLLRSGALRSGVLTMTYSPAPR